MQLNAYLTFDGQCEAAFKFYAQCLGGEIIALLPFAGSPGCEAIPAEFSSKIMHARLAVRDQILMGSDCLPEQPYEAIKGCSVALNVDSPQEAERIFNALAHKGTVQMPLQQTFWAVRFGMLVDQFGVPWMVNCEQAA